MTTITYTYDEKKATNKDYLIAVLTDSIDDGGASYESVARYDMEEGESKRAKLSLSNWVLDLMTGIDADMRGDKDE